MYPSDNDGFPWEPQSMFQAALAFVKRRHDDFKQCFHINPITRNTR